MTLLFQTGFIIPQIAERCLFYKVYYCRVHEKLRDTETREGASFGALFRSALWLGIVSRRRVYYETIKYEKERNAGFLSPFGYSAVTVAAAVDTVRSMEVMANWLHTYTHARANTHTHICMYLYVCTHVYIPTLM